MAKFILRSEEGFVLAAVVTFTLILTIIGMSFLNMGGQERIQVRHEADSVKAFWLAEAGVDLAICELNGGGTWSNWYKTSEPYLFPAVPGTGGLSTGDISISITDPSSATPLVNAIGYAPNMTSPKGERHVTAKLEKPVSPAFDYCVATEGDLTLEDIGTGVIGDVHSNGDIVDENVNVTGAGTAVGTITINGGGFSEGYKGGASEVTIPTLDMSYYETNRDVLHSGGWTESGTYDLSGGIHYVTGDFTASGATINGPGTIVATGKIKIEEGAAVGSADGMVGLFSNSNDSEEAVKIETGSDCHTAIFAPNGGAKIEGPEETPSSVYGSIVADVAKIETGGQLEYVDSSGDVDLPGSTTFSISVWSE